jgi:hypothetical protein
MYVRIDIYATGKKVLAEHLCVLNVLVFGVTAVMMKATLSIIPDTEHPQSKRLMYFYVCKKKIDFLQITKWCVLFKHFT